MGLSRKSTHFAFAYCLSALLAFLPIILYVPRYIDDYGRSVKGTYNWKKSGFRPLADWLYSAFNLGGPATALSPLGQLTAIPISAIGAIAISRTFQVNNPFLAVAATLPLFVNPYFLENLSYGFDSLSMTAALTLAVIAASQVRTVGPFRRWMATTVCLIASLFFYQPAFGAYLPLALTAWLWQRSETSNTSAQPFPGFSSLVSLLSAPAASLSIYGLCSKLFWLKRSEYGDELSRLISPVHLIKAVAEIQLRFLHGLWINWHETAFLPMFLLLTTLFVVALSVRLSRIFPRKQSYFIAALMPAILIFIAPGPMYLISSVDFTEIPRLNAFIGGLFASLALPVASYASSLPRRSIFRIVNITIILAWAWCQFVFSYAYGHAMQAQREYEQGRLTRLIYDVSHLDVNRQAKIIQFEGAMPASPLLANTTRKFPFMDKLVPRMINGPWSWGAKQLTWQGFSFKSAHKNPASPTDVMKAQACSNDPTSRCSSEHNIVLAGEHLIVKMK
jgi:hypothetical protein